jgi:putative SOS response-associated peptidase YedK
VADCRAACKSRQDRCGERSYGGGVELIANDHLSRPLFAFAGIWRLWTGERKGETGEHQLFSFLTTLSNDVVRPIHAKAMPVLLTTDDEWNTWLDGSLEQAITLQRPLPNELLRIVVTGEKSDQVLVSE